MKELWQAIKRFMEKWVDYKMKESVETNGAEYYISTNQDWRVL